jgi:hypothetical protein
MRLQGGTTMNNQDTTQDIKAFLARGGKIHCFDCAGRYLGSKDSLETTELQYDVEVHQRHAEAREKREAKLAAHDSVHVLGLGSVTLNYYN